MAAKELQGGAEPAVHPALAASSFYDRLTAGVDQHAEGATSGSGALPAAATSKKRGRDIRGLERFRQVVFGENGWPRLQAMAARNPTLMYPPPGIDAARERLARAHLRDTHAADDAEEAIAAMCEERRRAEADAQGDPDAPSTSTPTDQELAHYHRAQLDAFVTMLYEFNHLTFVKLPMSDTVQLLGRCGREAVAHVTEYETRMRLQHAARVSEVRGLRAEEERLHRRRLEVEAEAARRALEEAEQRQCALDAVADVSEHTPRTAECDKNDAFVHKNTVAVSDANARRAAI